MGEEISHKEYIGEVVKVSITARTTVDSMVIEDLEKPGEMELISTVKGLSNDKGTEVTVNFNSDEIENSGIFYTDSNGMMIEKRQLDYRPWNGLNNTGYEATSNYYPINAYVQIQDDRDKDEHKQMTIYNDRS